MPRLLGDDAAAFDAFVVARRGSLMRTALLLTGDRGRAEDLVQTALFETFRRWSRLRERADPGASGRPPPSRRSPPTGRRWGGQPCWGEGR